MHQTDRSLSGKTALVTGASRGIGRAIAMEFARQGANVVVNFLNSRDAAIEVASQIDSLGGRVMIIRADVSDADDVSAMVDRAAESMGSLDVVVSNAAAGGFRPLAEMSAVNFEAVIRTNASPAIWLAQASAKYLADSSDSDSESDFWAPHSQSADRPTGRMGKFLAVSSHGSRWAVPNYGAIGASKAALEAIVRHLALEFGPLGINFNCILSGIVPTEAIQTMPHSDRLIAAAGERAMIGKRSLMPENVADLVAFLASSRSDMIQGQTIVIDGGVSVRV